MDNHQSNQEHKQLQDLPLPDMEQSWEKMKQLLDQDDNNRRPVVPVFLKSCAGWGFLLLLAGAVTWLILNAEISSKDTTAKQTEKKVPQTNPSSRIPSSSNSLPASTSASPVTKTNTTVSLWIRHPMAAVPRVRNGPCRNS